MIANVSGFLRNVKSELLKVTWPTKKDTYASTYVVIVFVVLVAIYLWGIDSVLSVLIKKLLSG
ncbi:MAG: preprotein translocase subunit SecE [Desulfuromonas sp.]|nr:preprotein translocase subunit SecE [Desulfuromonas sp.]